MLQTLMTDLLVLMVFSKKPQPDMLRGYKVVAQAEPRPAPGIETSAVLKVEKEQKEEELSVKAVSVNPILSNESIRQAVINRPTPQEVQSMIDRYAGEYGVDPGMMKKIASCESGFRSEANAGPYGGMYQFLASTWTSNRQAMGLDPNPALRYNGEEAIKTAAYKMSRNGYGAWPVCSQI